MKITPVANPSQIQQTQPSDKRAAAIAAFNKGQSTQEAAPPAQAQETPVADPNQVSPEEMSALNIPVAQIEEQPQEQEVPQESAETKPEVDPKLSRQFAQLARQAKQLRLQQKQVEQQKAELEQQKASLTEIKPDYSNYISKDDLKRQTLVKLSEAGITYDDLTQQILNSPGVDPRMEALLNQQAERIAQLESKIDEGAKQQVKAQDEAYKAALRQIETDARSLVKNDPNYETIRATNSIRDVVELIDQTYKKDGIVLSVEEAATEVENYLLDEALKLTKIGKIKSRLAEAAQPKPVQKTSSQQTQPTPMKTLTNAHSNSRQLSARERAILAFKNELK